MFYNRGIKYLYVFSQHFEKETVILQQTKRQVAIGSQQFYFQSTTSDTSKYHQMKKSEKSLMKMIVVCLLTHQLSLQRRRNTITMTHVTSSTKHTTDNTMTTVSSTDTMVLRLIRSCSQAIYLVNNPRKVKFKVFIQCFCSHCSCHHMYCCDCLMSFLKQTIMYIISRYAAISLLSDPIQTRSWNETFLKSMRSVVVLYSDCHQMKPIAETKNFL